MSGTVTISVELELGWGYHDIDAENRYRKLSQDRRKETKTLDRFLSLLDAYEIPITFDVVGHLFLDSCTGHHEGPYPDGWFDEDPGSDAETRPLFYAPDMIESISQAEMDHEICTHTFSHILCDEVSQETLLTELETVQSIHREYLGQSATSLVAPRHRDVPKSVLREFDIDILRVPVNDLPKNRIGRLYQYLFGEHPVREPAVVDEVTETYTSEAMSLTAYHLPTGETNPHPVFRILPRTIREYLHTKYLESALERACAADSYIHLWTHLHDITNDIQWSLVRSFIELLGDAVDRGEARVATMADLSSHVDK